MDPSIKAERRRLLNERHLMRPFQAILAAIKAGDVELAFAVGETLAEETGELEQKLVRLGYRPARESVEASV